MTVWKKDLDYWRRCDACGFEERNPKTEQRAFSTWSMFLLRNQIGQDGRFHIGHIDWCPHCTAILTDFMKEKGLLTHPISEPPPDSPPTS